MHRFLLCGLDVGAVMGLLLLIPRAETVGPVLAFLIGALLYIAHGKVWGRCRRRNRNSEKSAQHTFSAHPHFLTHRVRGVFLFRGRKEVRGEPLFSFP